MRPASANAGFTHGVGSAVRIDSFDDPPIEDRGVSASFLKMFTEKHGLHGPRDCRFEAHHRVSCGWCGACRAWVPFDASPGATQLPCAHGRWPCRTGARHAHGCHRQVYPDHSMERPCSGRHATTTRQVHRDVIVRETLQRRCRYVRLMRGQTDEAGRPYYGKAFAFVSHSWDSEWAELLDAICAHSDRWVRDHPAEEPPYYWVDIFAINQHSGTVECTDDMPDWDHMAPDHGFQRVIQRTGTVLALQDSWVDPRVVHRAWCLYEMTTALALDTVHIEATLSEAAVEIVSTQFAPVAAPAEAAVSEAAFVTTSLPSAEVTVHTETSSSEAAVETVSTQSAAVVAPAEAAVSKAAVETLRTACAEHSAPSEDAVNEAAVETTTTPSQEVAAASSPSRVPICARGFHRVEALIGGEDLRRMRATIGSSSKFHAIEKQIGRIDVRNAYATVPSDRDRIFALVEREGGYEQLNERIRATQRRLLVEHARRMLDQHWTADELAAEPWLTRALARLGWMLPWALRFAALVAIGSLAFAMYLLAKASTTADFREADLLGEVYGVIAVANSDFGVMLLLLFLDAQHKSRLGPRRDIGRVVFGEHTMRVWAGVGLNFVMPIGYGLGPLAVMLVFRRWYWTSGIYSPATVIYWTSKTYEAYAINIAFGSMALAVIQLIAYLASFMDMRARAELMITVARLAERSAMLDVAERCLRDCLELCARYGGPLDRALVANARLVALLVHSGRMAEATPHELAVRDLCAAQLTGWRGFLRRYVALGAPRSLTGLLGSLGLGIVEMDHMADLGAAYAMAELHAGLQHADAVAELTKACEMGLAFLGVDNDEHFEGVRLQKPEEFAVLRVRIAENKRKRRRAQVWRRLLGGLIYLGLMVSFTFALVELSAATEMDSRSKSDPF
jgi:hypothetical protein